MRFFANSDATKNIKYLRWASKVLKIILVINTLNGLLGVCLLFSGSVTIISQTNVAQTPDLLSTSSVIFNVLAGVFLIYTAARALELFADVAERIMNTSEQQSQPLNSPDSPSEKLTTGD